MFNWKKGHKKTKHRRVAFKSTAWLAAAVAMGGSGFSAQAQEGQPQPTPNVEAVASVSLSSNKSSVCAGGIGSPVHQATITATVKNSQGSGLSGKSVSFVVENADENGAPDELGSVSASNPTSGSPLTVTTGSGGTATVTFTSSRVIGASNIIKATSEGKDGTTSISMADVNGNPTISKQEMIADGIDNAELRISLSSGGSVDGHSIAWRIASVTYKNEAGNTVDVDSADFASYGSVTPLIPVTNTSGLSTAKFTTGTKGGSITFEATDTSVSIKSGGTGGFGGQSAGANSTASTPQPKSFQLTAAAIPMGTILVAVAPNAMNIGDHAYLRIVNFSTGQSGWYGFYPMSGIKAGVAPVEGEVRPTAPSGIWVNSYNWVKFTRPAGQISALMQQVSGSAVNPPNYQLRQYNCSDWVADMLAGAGFVVDSDSSDSPMQLYTQLRAITPNEFHDAP